MELLEFIKNFSEELDYTSASQINEDTVLEDLDDWDSITALQEIGMIKFKYDKVISTQELKECVTVKDFYDLVANK